MNSSPQFSELSCLLEHRVSYGETDAMGIVYYANYLHFFERGRSELIRSRGISYDQVEARGFFLPVRKAECRYLAPARYDQMLCIRTGLHGYGRASMSFVYEITEKTTKRMLAKGSTQHALVNTQGQPVAIPHWLQKLFAPGIPETSDDVSLPK